MEILLGVDTLSYHCRLAAKEISLEQVLAETQALGFGFVQLNAVHLAGRSPEQIGSLRSRAEEHGLGLTLAGGMVGLVTNGDSVESGVDRVRGWVELAASLGSPYVRVSSGFYRADMLPHLDRIRAEQQYVVDVLTKAVQELPDGMNLLVENHSDFTAEEYVELIEGVGSPKVGVFLDVINPISAFQEPEPVVRRLLPWAPAGHVKDFRLVSRYVEDGVHRRGFDVQWCYPGEGVADLRTLMGILAAADKPAPYLLSIEGLDNYAGVADQRDRLTRSLALLRDLLGRSGEATRVGGDAR